jgi:hypothetical protein
MGCINRKRREQYDTNLGRNLKGVMGVGSRGVRGATKESEES